MPSTYWYYGLIIISLILLAMSLRWRRDWKLLVLQINIAAIVHPAEIVVLIWLEAYRYLPGFLPDPGLDNYLGSYVSNMFILPAAATAMNAFSLSWRHILVIAAMFAGVDWYFTVLGIYVHYWWNSFYTWAAVSTLLAVSRPVWSGLREPRPSPLFRLGIIYLTYAPVYNLIIFAVNQGGRFFRFQIPWLGYAEKYHQILFHLHLLATGLIVTLCVGLKLRFRYRLAGVAALVFINWNIGHFAVFVPLVAELSAQVLLPVSLIALSVVVMLFRAAKLDYLFP
ncbi:MAG: hypothetical protein P4N41_01000 [Negativicutes bacterium]|nr:hypothetical protein [Negativicutes bacterium]